MMPKPIRSIFASGLCGSAEGRAFTAARPRSRFGELQRVRSVAQATKRRAAWRPEVGGGQAAEAGGTLARLACRSAAGSKDFTLRGLVAELAARGPEGRLPLGVGVRARRRAIASKKDADRQRAGSPRRARRRAQWVPVSEPDRSAPGWSSSTRPGPRPTWHRSGAGRRRASGIKARVPHGHWKTMTFIAALRHDRVDGALARSMGRSTASASDSMSRRVLVPTLEPGDIVILDNLGSHKGKAVRRSDPQRRRQALLPAALQPRPQSVYGWLLRVKDVGSVLMNRSVAAMYTASEYAAASLRALMNVRLENRSHSIERARGASD